MDLESDSHVINITKSPGRIEPNQTMAVWFNKEMFIPEEFLSWNLNTPNEHVLGANTGEKRIEIDLTKQRLVAFDGKNVAFEFPISSGLPWSPTVTGEFRVWAKVRSQRMTGGSKENGTYYDLPNVPYVQYFHKGYGIHGAYWHTEFGKPRSHGCVNLSPSNAQKLFFWTSPEIDGITQTAKYNISPDVGTLVIVRGQAVL